MYQKHTVYKFHCSYIIHVIIWTDRIAGYYMNGGTACPYDTYKAGSNIDTSCTSCQTGHSTNGGWQGGVA